MNEFKWFDVDDCLPEHRQFVWCISEEDWNKRYKDKNYGTPDHFDVEFGEHWKDGMVEYHFDLPPIKIKKWFPFPKL